MPFLLGISLLLLVQGWDGSVALFGGLILLVLFAAYLICLLVKARQHPQEDSVDAAQRSPWQMPLTLVRLTAIVLGSNLAVDAACAIARLLGMSERFIGLTIVALGTSLPELFTSVIAARKVRLENLRKKREGKELQNYNELFPDSDDRFFILSVILPAEHHME